MELDINTVRGIVTTLLLIAFLGMVFWAFSGKRKKDFDEAARLALIDNPPAEREENNA